SFEGGGEADAPGLSGPWHPASSAPGQKVRRPVSREGSAWPAESESGFRAAWPAPGRSETPRALLSIAPVEGFPLASVREYSALSWSFCSRLCHHPVARPTYKSDGHGLLAFVVLHGIDGGFRMVSFRPPAKLYSIAKLQRQRRKKNGVARTAKLHDGRLLQVRCAAARRGNLHGGANPPP